MKIFLYNNIIRLTKFIMPVLVFTSILYIAIALMSYNPNDPSFNRATGYSAQNITGYYGAYIADPLLQIFGLTNILIILILMSWSFRFITKKKIDLLFFRFISFIICLISSSIIFSEIPPYEKWSFISLGGYFGYFIKNYLAKFLPNKISFFLLSTISICSFTYSINISYKYIVNILCFVFRMIIYYIKLLKFRILEYTSKNNLISNKEYYNDILDIPDIKAPERQLAENQAKTPILPKFNIKKKSKTIQSSVKNLLNIEKTIIFNLPKVDLLSKVIEKLKVTDSEINYSIQSNILQQTLSDFGISGKIISISPGPVVTLYELEPAAGVKSSRVIGLADDIARSMSALSTRIAVVPGRNAIGIELPNINREIVYLRELLESREYKDDNLSLPIILGKDIGGSSIVVDLAKMPHLLVAGTTGSGKSVAINTMILSILYRLTPDECRFIMIDPKMLELSVYDGIPHLLTPVVTEPSKAIIALKWTVKEMENRYRLMSNLAVRNISGYNKKIIEAQDTGDVLERTIQTGFEPTTGKPIYEKIPIDMKPLPYIVVIVDEMADLMLVAGKDIESSIQRLAQMARAAGIHIIMATQRPSVDVITGVIKANFPTRISFQVSSRIDSRTILGEQGAEQLLGMGDMLYMAGGSRISRVHGPFVGDREVEEIVNFLKMQNPPNYIDDITKAEENPSGDSNFTIAEESNGDDDLYSQAVQIIIRDKKVSTSYIQRSLRIGYNRAAIIIEKMEKEGIVSKANHVGKREILIIDQD